MPTLETTETVSHVENSLKAYLKGGSQTGDLSQSISSSVKKALLENVEFTAAEKPVSLQVDELRTKYISLNPSGGANPGVASNGNSASNGIQGANKRQNAAVAVDDMPEPRVVLCSPNKVQLNWATPRRIGPGLVNMGNTCFLNSVMQCLTYTAPFANYILSGEHKSSCRQVGFCTFCEISAHIHRALTGRDNVLRPNNILRNLKCIAKEMSWGKQEDSHEFLRLLLDNIQKGCCRNIPNLDNLSKETTIINQIFGGYLRSQVLCLKCHHRSSIYETFLDLSLDIKNLTEITKALERFVQPDQLEGKNAYKCNNCKNTVQAQKRFSIHRAPNVLTLQLKRFQFGGSIFGSGKMTKHVMFPTRLNLRPYMSVTKGDPVMYNLYGVICHSGYSCNSGHYFAYVCAPNKSWYVMNDSHVNQVPLGRVMNAEAYMLFYLKATPGLGVGRPNTPATNKPLIGPQLPGSKMAAAESNGSHGSRGTGTPAGPKRPLVSETVTSATAAAATAHAQGSRIPPANQRDRVSFGIKLPSNQQQNAAESPSTPSNKPRIVMHIKSGKVVSLSPTKTDQSQNEAQQQKHASPSKLVPYGGDSEEEEDVGTPVNKTTEGKEKLKLDTPVVTASKEYNRKNFPKAGSLSPQRKSRKESFVSKCKEIHTDRVLSSSPERAKKPNTLRRSLSADGMLSVNTNSQTFKLNATTGAWLVSERNKVPQSPSVASECSNSSVNSTTEWSVRDKKRKAKGVTSSGVAENQVPGWPVKMPAGGAKSFAGDSTTETDVGSDTPQIKRPASPRKMKNLEERMDNGEKSDQDERLFDDDDDEKQPLLEGNDNNEEEVQKPKKRREESPERETVKGAEDFPPSEMTSSEKRKKKKKKKKRKKHKNEDRERLLDSSQSDSDDVNTSQQRKHSKKKRRHSSDSDDVTGEAASGGADAQFVWVERTKETLDVRPGVPDAKRSKYGDGDKVGWGPESRGASDPWAALDAESPKKQQQQNPDPWNIVDSSAKAPSSGKSPSVAWNSENGRNEKPWGETNGGSNQTPSWKKPQYNNSASWNGQTEASWGNSNKCQNDEKRRSSWGDNTGGNKAATQWDRPRGGGGGARWDGTRTGNSDVLAELKGFSGARGFGSGVEGWDGGRSAVDRSVEEDRERERKQRLTTYDEYEAELDEGHVKKTKRKFEEMAAQNNHGNPFQRFQDGRNNNNNNYSYGARDFGDTWRDRNNRNYGQSSRDRYYSGPPGGGGGYYRHGDNNRRYDNKYHNNRGRGSGYNRPRHSYGGDGGGYNNHRSYNNKYYRNY